MRTPAQRVYAQFVSYDGDFPIETTNTSEIWYAGNIIQNTSDSYGNSGKTQTSVVDLDIYSCGNAVQPWQFPASLTETERMDGTQVYAFTDTGITGATTTSAIPPTTLCDVPVTSLTQQYGSDFFDDHWSYVVSNQYFDSSANLAYSAQYIETRRFAGDVTYFSQGYSCYWDQQPSGNCNNPADYYTWNSSGINTYGTIIPVGSTWVPSVAVQDSAGNTASGSISVLISNSPNNYSLPTTCQGGGPDIYGYTYQYCSSYYSNFTVSSGDATK